MLSVVCNLYFMHLGNSVYKGKNKFKDHQPLYSSFQMATKDVRMSLLLPPRARDTNVELVSAQWIVGREQEKTTVHETAFIVY